MSNEYKQTLARFEAAVRAHEMRGTQPPSDIPQIEKEYEDAKRALVIKLTYRSYRQKDSLS